MKKKIEILHKQEIMLAYEWDSPKMDEQVVATAVFVANVEKLPCTAVRVNGQLFEVVYVAKEVFDRR